MDIGKRGIVQINADHGHEMTVVFVLGIGHQGQTSGEMIDVLMTPFREIRLTVDVAIPYESEFAKLVDPFGLLESLFVGKIILCYGVLLFLPDLTIIHLEVFFP